MNYLALILNWYAWQLANNTMPTLTLTVLAVAFVLWIHGYREAFGKH